METQDTSASSEHPREDDRNDELDESPVPDPGQDRDDDAGNDPEAD